MDGLKEKGVPLIGPFLTFDDIGALVKLLAKTFPGIAREKIAEAEQAKKDVCTKGEESWIS